ncbi:hypothetical protein [Thiohalorhabdus methylotrophus]|uniref:NUDIX hydrolase n=1 Tax=Thiohalorhabdus methylotrophus TaxID=3242694 RepID=A0ABV4TZL4_9GAMM
MLQERLGAVGLLPPRDGTERPGTGTLEVIVRHCRLDSHQWDVGPTDPDITYYLTLVLDIRLEDSRGKMLLERRLEWTEQAHTDIPLPPWDLTTYPVAERIGHLFSAGRYRAETTGTE